MGIISEGSSINQIKRLEQAAIEAHDLGKAFKEFLEEHKSKVHEARAHSSKKFSAIYLRIIQLVICGSKAGKLPFVEDVSKLPIPENAEKWWQDKNF